MEEPFPTTHMDEDTDVDMDNDTDALHWIPAPGSQQSMQDKKEKVPTLHSKGVNREVEKTDQIVRFFSHFYLTAKKWGSLSSTTSKRPKQISMHLPMQDA